MLMHDHEAFFPPENNHSIWRYLDFTKFVSLLETSQLYFPRADQFEDPYEGTWSKRGIEVLRDPRLNNGLPTQAVEQFINAIEIQRKQMFINCWYANEHESAAMWKLYLQTNEGVAIRSDSDTLTTILDKSKLNIGLSMVQYIDYDKTIIPFRNLFFPFVHKRLSFAHENELRAIIWSVDSANKPEMVGETVGLSIDINIQELIKSVYVAPTAPKWFGPLVQSITKRYGLGSPVICSSLYDRPAY